MEHRRRVDTPTGRATPRDVESAAGHQAERERGVETLNPVRYRTQAALLAQVLDGVGDHLTAAFKAITGASHVERIDVVFGRSGPVALDVVVELTTGSRCFPQQIFSEGYRDLLAILFFAVVAQRAAEHGQARVLILDDVFQSVDASIRRGTVDYLLREFKDWQLIFTVHDRLWLEQLRNAYSRHNHTFVERELRRWSFESGPTVVTAPSTLTTALQYQLDAGDPAGICSSAGRLLEQACDHLSWRLGTSVVRRVGDKYTLGDLWPGVSKACRKTSLGPVCNRVDELYALRNLAGAHYNQWAEALSLDEAERFGAAVLEFGWRNVVPQLSRLGREGWKQHALSGWAPVALRPRTLLQGWTGRPARAASSKMSAGPRNRSLAGSGRSPRRPDDAGTRVRVLLTCYLPTR